MSRSISSGVAAVRLTPRPRPIDLRLDLQQLVRIAEADAVDRWLATVPDDYRLNAEFQAFKATARRFSGDENPERQAGQWWRALDT